jgi:hypothetical protein
MAKTPVYCFEATAGGYPVVLTQQGKNRFTVQYGQQIDTGLSYADAARKLGEAIMHGTACDGRIRQEG